MARRARVVSPSLLQQECGVRAEGVEEEEGGGRALSPVLASRDTNVQLQGAKRQSVISRQLAEATKKQNGVSADEYKCSFNPAINENSRKYVTIFLGNVFSFFFGMFCGLFYPEKYFKKCPQQQLLIPHVGWCRHMRTTCHASSHCTQLRNARCGLTSSAGTRRRSS